MPRALRAGWCELENVKVIEDGEVDWNLRVGHYTFTRNKEAENKCYNQIMLRSTGSTIPVPVKMQIPFTDVGVSWRILFNWSCKQAELCYVPEGTTWRLYKKFNCDVQAR